MTNAEIVRRLNAIATPPEVDHWPEALWLPIAMVEIGRLIGELHARDTGRQLTPMEQANRIKDMVMCHSGQETT